MIKSPQVRALIIAGLVLLPVELFGAGASNASANEPALDGVSLEQLMEMPVESVTGVSKYEQAIRRAPAGVTVFTAADMKNHGWKTLSDALRASPGLHVRNDRFYEYLGTRGFTRSYDYNARTLILLDGHRLDDSIYQQGAIGTDFILDLDMVERIEIIRGPGSSIYGSNAFYGAVNVIPKTGRDIAGAQVGISYGSEPSGKARVTVGDRTAGGVDYIVSATEWWSGGEDNFALPESWRAVAASRLTGESARNQDDMHHQSAFARASWRGVTAEAAYVQREKEVLPLVYFTPRDTEARGIDERAYFLIRALGEPTPESTIDAKVAIDYYHYDGLFTPPVTAFNEVNPYADNLSLSGEVRWRQTFADVQSVILGLEYQENLQQDFGVNLTGFGGIPVFAVEEASSYVSPFMQLDWEFTERLRASVGGRFDSYDKGEERFTPRIGFIWDPRPETTLKLLYGEAFRVPNVAERSPGETGIVQNPDIRPETNRTWEFIAEQRFGPVWRMETHFYHTVSNDLITTVSTNNPLDPTERTIGNEQCYITRGFDVGPAAYFASGVRLRASVTVQETYDDETDRIVADAPRALGKLHLSSPLAGKWLRASTELLYVGNRKDSGGVDGVVRDTGDYVTANVTLRTACAWYGWDLSLSVYNVADHTWSDPQNVGQISSSPRTFTLRAQRDF
jgi:iron complex outermembrane receptor protein